MRINNREELEKEGLFIITDIEDGLLDANSGSSDHAFR